MVQNDVLARAMYKVAFSKLGIKEATGRNDGVFVSMIQRWLANGAKWMDRQPWCANFATWCLYQAAGSLNTKPLLRKSGSSTDLYAQARALKLVLAGPKPFCIGLMKGNGGTPGKTHHHTFIVESIDLPGGVVHGIDGNWKNAVSRSIHAIKDCDFIAVA